MELYYGIMFAKRIPGMPGTSPELPGVIGIPWARPWDPPRDAPRTTGRAPGTLQGRPWNPPGTPRDPLGPQKRPSPHIYSASRSTKPLDPHVLVCVYICICIYIWEDLVCCQRGGERGPKFLPLQAGPMWPGPLWAPLGPCGPPWDLVGRAL